MTRRISVIIATHNRSDLLALALDGLARQTLGSHAFEVLVVDNASTDNTAETVRRYSDTFNALHYVFEGTLGLNVARNTGWRASTTPYVAYLDDDAVPSPDWLERILLAFATVTPRPSCVGGRVEPVYECPPPLWLTGALLDFISVVDHSPEPLFLRDITNRQKLAGVNMAFDRSALEAVAGFLPGLDRVGEKLLSGGDVLVQLQLEALGKPVYYDPGIRVTHHVAARRLTAAWMEDRAYWGGVSDALLSYYRRGGGVWWAGRTLSWGLRSVLSSPGHLMRLATQSRHDIAARCRAQHQLGFVTGGAWAIRAALHSVSIQEPHDDQRRHHNLQSRSLSR